MIEAILATLGIAAIGLALLVAALLKSRRVAGAGRLWKWAGLHGAIGMVAMAALIRGVMFAGAMSEASRLTRAGVTVKQSHEILSDEVMGSRGGSFSSTYQSHMSPVAILLFAAFVGAGTMGIAAFAMVARARKKEEMRGFSVVVRDPN